MYFAVIDTETNWHDRVMSIGLVISEWNSFSVIDSLYFVFTPEYKVGGMFSSTLDIDSSIICSRDAALVRIRNILEQYHVSDMFAYNARFDFSHLPEMSDVSWFDIMRLAAYKQFNKKIPYHVELCSTGRMKRNYGVESMVHMLTGNHLYCEMHNAVQDAKDELLIMKALGHLLDVYQENAVVYSASVKKTNREEFMNSGEAAALLGISNSKLYSLIRDKIIQADKINGRYCVLKVSVDEYIKNLG